MKISIKQTIREIQYELRRLQFLHASLASWHCQYNAVPNSPFITVSAVDACDSSARYLTVYASAGTSWALQQDLQWSTYQVGSVSPGTDHYL
jgi:hypothetical protein